jgi:peroxiredoxin Q/BCP
MKRALLILTAVLACNGPVKRPDGGEGLLSVGAVAPDVPATTKAGEATKLSAMLADRDERGVVVYFYPKDETPGCTKEACALRDAWTKFTAKHVGIIGVSRDTEQSHREFVKHHELPFPLSADEAGKIAQSYGVKSTLGMSDRVSFLIGRDGKIAKVWPKVDPAIHADDVLAQADQLPP